VAVRVSVIITLNSCCSRPGSGKALAVQASHTEGALLLLLLLLLVMLVVLLFW
jgi:hypothetical protein